MVEPILLFLIANSNYFSLIGHQGHKKSTPNKVSNESACDKKVGEKKNKKKRGKKKGRGHQRKILKAN